MFYYFFFVSVLLSVIIYDDDKQLNKMTMKEILLFYVSMCVIGRLILIYMHMFYIYIKHSLHDVVIKIVYIYSK